MCTNLLFVGFGIHLLWDFAQECVKKIKLDWISVSGFGGVEVFFFWKNLIF
jgi:hypothetical protein